MSSSTRVQRRGSRTRPSAENGNLPRPSTPLLEPDPLWYKDAIIYEVHVRAFYDSNGDGIGDFAGLRQKLPYLQELGVTAIWLLPFYPSPLRDDGYDIQDYYNVHESYGTLADFKRFLDEAHARGMRVITELVLNHTSDKHEWFQRARRAKRGSRERNYYVWSDTPDKYRDARVIFKDFEPSNWTWDPVAKQYYWHRFYSHQPDLNFESPDVRREIFKVIRFWLGLGVDGLRLDAVPYLYEQDGTNCENLPQTHAFLRKLRSFVDRQFANRMLLAEANQWPEDAVAYFGEPEKDKRECHMAFHFPLMPRLFMAIHTEDRFPIVDILEQTPPIPDDCQWALFLRNHDELTLEMVTDEERDYMYRVYAADPEARINLGIRRRLAPLLGNDRRKIELMNGLLFSLPGTPVIYYGDEIGMGDNIYLGDRDGVRTPMQWSGDRNAGFSRANPQKLYLPVIIDPEYHYEAVNVEAQEANPQSLLWWMRRLVAVRRRHRAFGRGSLVMLNPENPRVIAWIREYEGERILVVANLSRFTEFVELDLSAYAGLRPVELFGGTRFPTIGNQPYFFTLGPYSFFWFQLEREPAARLTTSRPEESPPTLKLKRVKDLWDADEDDLEEALASWICHRPWFVARNRSVRSVTIEDVVSLDDPALKRRARRNTDTDTPEAAQRPAATSCWLALVRVEFATGDPERYTLGVSAYLGESAQAVQNERPDTVIALLDVLEQGRGVLAESTDRELVEYLRFLVLSARSPRTTRNGATLRVLRGPERAVRSRAGDGILPVVPIQKDQSHTLVRLGDNLCIKIFRKIEEGVNPEWQLGRYLTQRHFGHAAPVHAAVEYRARRREPITLAILRDYVHQDKTAHEDALHSLRQFFDQNPSFAEGDGSGLAVPVPLDLVALAREEPPDPLLSAAGSFVSKGYAIGQMLGELHRLLAANDRDPAFAPESMTPFSQRAMYQSMRNAWSQAQAALKRALRDRDRRSASGDGTCTLPEQLQPLLDQIARSRNHVFRLFGRLLEQKLSLPRIRCHGNLTLRELLGSGLDYVVIDFEGNPTTSLGERSLKRPPLRDLASLLVSLLSVVESAIQGQERHGPLHADSEYLRRWGRLWYAWSAAAMVRGYRERIDTSEIAPRTEQEWRVVLECFLLERALRELTNDLQYGPHWLPLSLRVVHELLYLLGALPAEARAVRSAVEGQRS